MALVSNPYKSYSTAQVNTVKKGDLLIMLFDAAIRFLRETNIYIKEKKFLEKKTSIDNFQAIITELEMSLNYDHNKELANNLNKIYTFIAREISLANFQNDILKINSVIDILSDLRSAWKDINLQEKNK